ncbi:MAG: tyrosine-protein kinase family protein, partial [Gaiellales bacterium]
HRFFDLEAGPGVTDVALCHATLDQALATVAISSGGGTSRSNGNGNGNGNGTATPLLGLLSVLPAGELPHDPAGFLESAALSAVLDDLRSRADLVLIDAPPVLPVSDAMAISSKVDGMIVVSRLEVVHRGMLRELRRELDSTQVARLGLVLTGASSGSAYGYGSYSYGESSGQTDPKVAAASPRA